ncbi:MAG: folate-binding protein [Hydrogenothermaceae bacterium]|nr:folate-binding protein [Hydrogenothermaceae bacterium]
MNWIKLNRGKIRVYGKSSKVLSPKMGQVPDHVAFLNSILTNDIKQLENGKFNYNLMLTGKGYPIDDFFVLKDGEEFVLDFEGDSQIRIDSFNRLKLSLKVYFETLNLNHYFIFGEGSEEFLRENFKIENTPDKFQYIKTEDFYILRNPLRLGIDGFDIFATEEIKLNGREITQQEFESLRIKNCIPKINKELKEGIIPLETNIYKYAISFDKGCYTGQEVIARIYFRGKPPRIMAKFKLSQRIPEDTPIIYNDRKAGIITSVDANSLEAIGFILESMADTEKVYKVEALELKLLYICRELNIE